MAVDALLLLSPHSSPCAAESDEVLALPETTPTACAADVLSQGDGGADELSSEDDHCTSTTAECSCQQQCCWPSSSRFCLNCTSRLPEQPSDGCDYCTTCGHVTADDLELLDPAVALHQSQEPHAAHARPCKVALLYDERMELHEEELGDAPPHPERPERIRAVMARLLSSGTADLCCSVPCREATVAELQAVHTHSLVRTIHYASCIAPLHGLDPASLLSSDMYVNDNTYLCARLAAGSAAEAAVQVVRGDAPHAAAIIRPPGHHAESGMAQGFCFFNNAAVAARAAQAAGARRVIILDWDIHHGNGTQQIFEHDPSVLYLSIHRHDGGEFYPGTGAAEEVGTGHGRGYSVNVAWQGGGMGDHDYMAALQHIVLPIAREYSPDLLIVSAGFDAAVGDPIGECCVTAAGFAHMTAALKSVAPLCLLLEGGYNLSATAVSTDACLRVLLGGAPPPLPKGVVSGPTPAAWDAICETQHVQSYYWRCMGGLPATAAPPRSVSGRQAAGCAHAAVISVIAGGCSSGVSRGGVLAASTLGGRDGRCTIVRVIRKRALHVYWKRRQAIVM